MKNMPEQETGQGGDARTNAETKAELAANIQAMAKEILMAGAGVAGSPEKAAAAKQWLTERYGGERQANLALLASGLELMTIEMAENSRDLERENDPARKEKLQAKQVALTVKRSETLEQIRLEQAALQAEKQAKDAERRAKDKDEIDRIRKSLPKKG